METSGDVVADGKLRFVEHDLIYDFGMNDGRDTAFYLSKGFRVVAVEALPALCEEALARFADEVRSGALRIINAAIVDSPGPVTFYVNAQTAWGTVHRAWADRNALLGSPSVDEIIVDGVCAQDLFATHGIPYYVKVDIEGSDRACLEALLVFDDRPQYVSLESDKVSFTSLQREFDLLEQLGYRRFKVVPQHKVPEQRAPRPPLEGHWIQHTFEWGDSGLFGQETPGRWLTRRQAVALYRLIFLKYRLCGDHIHGKTTLDAKLGRGLRRLTGEVGWYDTHAVR